MRRFLAIVVTFIALQVAGCGSRQTSSPNPVNPATLYATALTPSAFNGVSVFRLDHASTANGSVAPSAILGPATLFASIDGMVVDSAANRLFIDSSFGSPSILVFDNASTKTGNVAPDRVVTGSATTLVTSGPMILDSSRDLLYVASSASNAASTDKILIFSHASTMSGNVAPMNTVDAPIINFRVGGLALDPANDRLFVADTNDHQIICFDHASQLGPVPLGSRAITGPHTGLAGPKALALDKSGRLYVGNELAGITVYANAGAIELDVAPTATIQGSNTQFHIPILLAIHDNPGGTDSGDLYVEDFQLSTPGTPTILVFTDIAHVNGNVAPSRVLTFPNVLQSGLALDTTR